MLKEKSKKIKNKIKNFFQKHKKELLIGLVGIISSIIAIILKTGKDDSGYNNSFFMNASDEELKREREKVRIIRNTTYDDVEYEKYYNLLNKFDRVISKRAWGDKTQMATSYSTEHGWYLSEDD